MLKMVGMSPTDMAPTTEATCPIEILQGVSFGLITRDRQDGDRGRRKCYQEREPGALSLSVVGVHGLGEGGGEESVTRRGVGHTESAASVARSAKYSILTVLASVVTEGGRVVVGGFGVKGYRALCA